MKRILLFFIPLFLLQLPLLAQQKISSTVEVKREYEGKLMEINKSPLDVKIADSLMKFNLNFDYTLFNKPYKDLYEFSPVTTTTITRPGEIKYPVFYSRLLLLYPWMPQADIYIQPKLNNRFSLSFNLNHDSFWGELPVIDINSSNRVTESLNRAIGDRMKNNIGVKGGYQWGKGRLYLDLDFLNGYNTYYGIKPFDFHAPGTFPNVISRNFVKENLSHIYNMVNAGIGVISVKPKSDLFHYDFYLKYRYTDDLPNLKLYYASPLIFSENLLLANGNIIFRTGDRGGVKIGFDYKIANEKLNNDYDYRDIASLSLQYRYELDRLALEGGAVFSGGSVEFSGARQWNSDITPIYPKLSAVYEAVKESLWLYLKIDGNNQLNNYSDLLLFNPWVNSKPTNFSHVSSTPFNSSLGLRGIVSDKFSYNLYGGYERMKCLLFFSTNHLRSSLSEPTYLEKADKFYTGLDLQFKSKDFISGVDFKYNYFQTPHNTFLGGSKTFVLPRFELNFYARYNLRERFIAELKGYYRSSIATFYTQTVFLPEYYYEIPGFIDLKLSLSYVVSNNFTLFIEGNNLLNQSILYIPNYFENGLNIGLGMCLKF